MAQPTLEILDKDEGFLFGKLDNLGIIVWRITPTGGRVQRVVAAFPRFEGERGFGLLTIVSPLCAPPDSEVRRLFDQAMRAYRDTLLGIATVVQTEGVFGGLSRAIARTLSIVSRTPYPHNVYATIEDASRWLPSIISRQSEPGLTASTIVEVIAEHYQTPRTR
jgi:hypothetical protein